MTTTTINKTLRSVFLFLAVVLFGNTGQAQTLGSLYAQEENEQLYIEEGASLKSALEEVEERYNVGLLYRSNIVEGLTVRQAGNLSLNLEEALSFLFRGTDLRFKALNPKTYGIYKNAVMIPQAVEATVQQTIGGTVVDAETGEALPGVNILIVNSGTGTTTDIYGDFELTVPSLNDTLRFSYIGYETIEIPINGRTEINVSLQTQAISGDELVVIGYGTQRRADLTGSISSIKGDDFEYTPKRNVASLIQGSVAGVNIVKNSEPGGNSIIRIRGGNSMIGGNDPLYVVDGLPGGSIGDLNNIESIEVLKDASATAIYGARGANGVIIVTTKRGGQTPEVNLNIDYGFQQPRKKLDLLNAREYAEFANEKAQNIGRSPYFENINNLPGNTDWQDKIFQTAPIANYDLSVSGGNNENRYAVFGNYSNQEGIIKGSDYSSGNIRVNLDNEIKQWFSLSTSILGSYNLTNRSYVKTGSQSLVFRALQAPPVVPAYDESGNFYPIRQLATGDPLWDNPMAIVTGFDDKSNSQNIEGNTNLKFDLSTSLEFNLRLGSQLSSTRKDVYLSRVMLEGGNGGRANVFETSTQKYLIDGILSYRKGFGSNNILNIDTGFNWEENYHNSLNIGASDFVKDLLGTNNLSEASNIDAPSSFKSKNTLISGIGRINYQFNNKYLITITSRLDGSSKFGVNNKWALFPSMALGWRMSEEKFMNQLEFVNDLKLRASYGITGNQDIGNYRSLSRLSTSTAIFGIDEQRFIGFAPNILGNPDLKWEKTKQFNIGLDLNAFNEKFSISLDYYDKTTEDLLATVPLALSSGFDSILKNFGKIENKGFEAVFNYTVLNNYDTSFSLGANISLNKNKVLEVANESGQFFAESFSSPINTPVNIIKEGHPLSSFYGYLEDGLWESDQGGESIQPNAKAGDQKYVDVDGDGSITAADKVILGSPFPDFTYGLNINLNYKRFDLYVLMQGVSGGLIFNSGKYTIGDSFARNGNQLAEVKDHWSEENPDPNAKYPRLSNVSPLVSDRYFEDASYLRFKTISLGCRFPIENFGWAKNLRIYLSAENFFTITNYEGFDPEVSSEPGSSLRKGVDYGAYPSAKTISLGIKIDL